MTVWLKGREKRKPELGLVVLDRIIGDLSRDVGDREPFRAEMDLAVSMILIGAAQEEERCQS